MTRFSCPKCRSADVYRSRPRAWDLPLRWLGLEPRRCLDCYRRFWIRPPHDGAAAPETNGEAVAGDAHRAAPALARPRGA